LKEIIFQLVNFIIGVDTQMSKFSLKSFKYVASMTLLLSVIPFAPNAHAATVQYIQSQHSGKCLHIPGNDPANGVQLTQWDCISQSNVQWRVEYVGDGLYEIKSHATGKCAQVNEGSNANGAVISQWDCVDQPNVKWKLQRASGEYYYIINEQTGKCLHLHGGSIGRAVSNNSPITQWKCVNQSNVKWRIYSAR
jgi:Ricin-type beta-trefoil lectin domain-like